MSENDYYYDTSEDDRYDNSYDQTSGQPQLRRIEGFLEDDIRAFVGQNSDKYTERFYCIARGQKPYNWCSALFAPSWMAYRKMWKPAIVLAVIVDLINSIFSLIPVLSGFLGSLVLLVFYFAVLGREGNALYWNFVKEELTKEGLANTPQPDYEKREQLRKKGGISLLFLVLFWIFNAAVNSLLGVLF